MRIALGIVLALATSARADDRIYEVGFGAPGGITFGLGVRSHGWQAVVDSGGAAAGIAMMASGSVHLHRDVATGTRTALAVGGSATYLGFFAGGAEGDAMGAVELAGPSLEVRYVGVATRAVVFEVGALFGRCHGDCDPRPFLMPGVTLRVDWGWGH
jgi:hypothetical protein